MIFKSCQFWFARLFCFVVGPNRQKKQNWGLFHFFSKSACVNAIRVSKYTPARTICNKSRLYSCLWTLGWYFCRNARAIVKSAPYQGTLECKMQETSCYIYTNNWTDLLKGSIAFSLEGLRQVSESWLQKRPPSQNLGKHRSVRCSVATSRSAALNFLFL